MSKLGQLRHKVIQKVATSRKASQIERQAIEDEFDGDLAKFVKKYGKYLSDADKRLLRNL